MDDTTQAPAAPPQDMNLVKILERLATRTEAGPVPQISMARAKIKTPWNPSGSRSRPKLSRPTYLNGHRLQEMLLSNEEIRLLNKLTAGKYQDRKWLVVEADTDRDGSTVQVFLPNKTESDRLSLKGKARNLTEALTLILDEAAAAKTK